MINKEKRKANLQKRDARKKASGECRQCSNLLFLESKLYCEKHWYENVAYKNLDDKLKGVEIKALAVGQKFICPYTKITLIPTINMSLDHKIPKSKGGSNDITNLQWIESNINYMKWDLTESEFIRLAKLIASNY